jgi:hypothetical protein
VRADLDSTLAAHALMGSFVFHSIAVGRPAKGWSEKVLDTLWPAFAAADDEQSPAQLKDGKFAAHPTRAESGAGRSRGR